MMPRISPWPRPPLTLAIAGSMLALGLAACGGDGPTESLPKPVASIEVIPQVDTLTALGAVVEFQAVARDADGNTISGATFTWSSSDGAVATVDAQGRAEAVTNGAVQIRASAEDVTGAAQLTVIQQVATVEVTPSSATLTVVGAAQQFSASALDANGNTMTGVTFAWSSSDEGVAAVDTAGEATAMGGGVAMIRATAQQVTGSAEMMVDQDIDRLAFRTEPSDATAGMAMDPAVEVEVLDPGGTLVEDATIAVTLSIDTNPGGGTLGGTTTVDAVGGMATFSDVWVDKAGAGYTLAASTPGTVTGAGSGSFDIAVGPAAQVAFTGQPSDATAGVVINPSVEVEIRDAYGNPVSDATSAVTVSIATNPGGGTLSGTLTVSAVAGVATFTDLSIEKTGAGYKLEAGGGGLASDSSAAFEILPAAAVQLGFSTPPTAAEGQEPISPTVEVEIQDTYGNRVTGSSASVTVALGADPTSGAATFAGTKTVSASGGLASFGDISLDLPAAGYSLQASAAGLSSVTSDTFSVNLTFADVSVGYYHSCGVTVANHAYCWGANGNGQLGDGTTTQRLSPVPVSGGHTFATIEAGGTYHSCALTVGNQAYCWGSNSSGQVGDGTTTERHAPVAVSGGLTFATLESGGGHVCGITTGDVTYCWGDNRNGQLGDGTTTNRSAPLVVTGGLSFATISAGTYHTCGVTSGDAAYCWGYNILGQLGDSTTIDRHVPVAVSGGHAFITISAATFHSCAVTTGDEAYCWGYNAFGQLGDGTTTQRLTPVAVAGGLSFATVSTGSEHSCGVTTGDAAYCWGYNINGRLGDGTTAERHAPVAVSGGLSFATLSAGAPQSSSHTCGMTTSSVAYCWGLNVQGQLGDGTTGLHLSPVRVKQ